MGKGITGLETAYRGLFTAVLIILAILVILCLVRAIIGPRIADRIVSVNMMGTMVIVIIAILTVMLGEGYLADICIIYAMISFLAVIVLTKVYMGVYLERKNAGNHTAREEAGVSETTGAAGTREEAGVSEATEAGKMTEAQKATGAAQKPEMERTADFQGGTT